MTIGFVHIVFGLIVLWLLFAAILGAIGVLVNLIAKTPAMARWWGRKAKVAQKERNVRHLAKQQAMWSRAAAKQAHRQEAEFWHGKKS